MNELIKELAAQAGLVLDGEHWFSFSEGGDVSNTDLELFAELVRQDLYQVTGKSVIEQINSAIQIEREACAKLCEEVGRQTAAAIRARGNHGKT